MISLKQISRVIFLFIGLVVLTFSSGCFSRKEENPQSKALIEVDFDTSMGKGTTEHQSIFANEEDVQKYNLVKNLYENNRPSNVAFSEKPKIPKIIHQIWIGPKMPPSYFISFQERLKALHPDWEYHLWTDSELSSIDFELKDLIDRSTNFAEQSDLIRSELLERFGGVYIDVDIDPLMALNELHHKYDFYIGLENPHIVTTSKSRVWAGISIIASCPGHPVIKRWKELIRAGWEESDRTHSSSVDQIVNHTFFPFSKAFFEKAQEGDYINIAFPTTYFYPLAPNYAAKRRSFLRSCRERVYEVLEGMNLKRPRAFSRLRPETIAVHYWGNSWLPSQPTQLKTFQYQLTLLKKELYEAQKRLAELEARTAPTKEVPVVAVQEG